MVVRLAVLVCAVLLASWHSARAEVSLTDRQSLAKQQRSAARGTGDLQLVDASGLEWFLNTDMTYTTASSASGAASEASFTTSVTADTELGGTTVTFLTDAFDGYNGLVVNGVSYNMNGPGALDASGRQYVYPDQAIGNLTVSRKVFVPDNDAFARWLNIVTNNGPSSEQVSLVLLGNLGSDGATRIAGSSDGDTQAETEDAWIVTFENWNVSGTSGDPRLAHVFRSERGGRGFSSLNLKPGSDLVVAVYEFNLAPGETGIVMVLASGQPTLAGALAKGAELAGAPPNALQFMSADEIDQVINFGECGGDGLSAICRGIVESMSTGDTLSVDVLVNNDHDGPLSSTTGRHLGVPPEGDFYFGALLPDGDTIVYFSDLGFSSPGVGSLSDVATLAPIAASVDLETPFRIDIPGFFEYTFSGAEPAGDYLIFLAGVMPGAFADGTVDPGDMFSLATVPFSFEP